MQTFSLRFTPHPVELPSLSDWSFDFLDKYERYILAREDKDKMGRSVPVHYHVYIETSYGEASVRQQAKAALRLPASGRGKNNGYYSCIPNWKDPGYICKYNEIQNSKGFTEKELLDLVDSGRNKYLVKVEKTPAENSVTADQSSTTPKCPRVPYQQLVIAYASAEWYKYKRECREQGFEVVKENVIEFVCDAMRHYSKGINQYLLQDLVTAVLYDDVDYRTDQLEKLKSRIRV